MNFNYKPNDGEFPIFYKGYIDTIDDLPLIGLLEKEKTFALEVLKKVDGAKSEYRYAEGKWSIKQVLLHIIDAEMVFAYRAMAISRGDKQSLPGFNQDEYMSNISAEAISYSQLVQMFESLRNTNIALFQLMNPKNLLIKGKASGYDVTPKALGYFIAGHCKYHILMLEERYDI
jgi:hypothetical protein